MIAGAFSCHDFSLRLRCTSYTLPLCLYLLPLSAHTNPGRCHVWLACSSGNAAQDWPRVHSLTQSTRYAHPGLPCLCKTYLAAATLPLQGRFPQLAVGFDSLRRLFTARIIKNAGIPAFCPRTLNGAELNLEFAEMLCFNWKSIKFYFVEMLRDVQFI